MHHYPDHPVTVPSQGIPPLAFAAVRTKFHAIAGNGPKFDAFPAAYAGR